MDFQIVTISNRVPTEWYYMQDLFYRSLEGFEVNTINYTDSPWIGLTTKVRWLQRAIKEGKLTAKYLIYTDSWDMVFATSPEEIMQLFKNFSHDIVVSCEKNCFPTIYLNEQLDKAKDIPSEYKYLNSGFIVGRTEAILHCLEAMDLQNVPGDHYSEEKKCVVNPEDQTLWTEVYLKPPVKILLDHYQILNQTLHETTIDEFDLSYKRKRIGNKATGSLPCTFHFNGGSKSNMELRTPILKHLNLLQ